MRRFLITIIISLTLISCQEKQPSCSASDVKILVQEIVEEELIVALSFTQYVDDYQYDFLNQVLKNSTDLQEVVEREKEIIRNELNNPEVEKSRYSTLIEKIKPLISDSMMEITNIRVSEVNKELRKCTCEAKMSFNFNGEKKSDDVKYTAQINDEEEVYVEVLLEKE